MRRLLNTISRTLERLADWAAHGRRAWVSAALSNDDIIEALSPDQISDAELMRYSKLVDMLDATLLPARITDIEIRRLLLYVYPGCYGVATSPIPDEIVPIEARVILTIQNPTPYIRIPETVEIPSEQLEAISTPLARHNRSPSSLGPLPDLVIYPSPSGRKVARLLSPNCQIRTTTRTINNIDP